MPKDCFWTVFNRREGVLKSFAVKGSSARAKGRARAWQRENRPRGTRILLMCIPPKE